MGLFSAELVKRFTAKVEIIPFAECHYWNAATCSQGYGRFGVDGEMRLAHRIAYEIEYGPIPLGPDGLALDILHSCDNPNCVNPAHLRSGTALDNMKDKVARGRQSRGENHGAAKLSDEDVREVARRMDAGETRDSLCSEYQVSPSRLALIRHGRTRSAASGIVVSNTLGRSDRQISAAQAREVYSLAYAGVPRAEIARRFGISRWSVSDIKRGMTYASATGHRR